MQFERIADKKRVSFITSEIIRAAPPGSEVLDVGCGNGFITKAVALQGFRVTGIDVSEKTIDAARALNHHPNIQFKVVAAGELEPEPGRYQAIICSEVLEHLKEPKMLLNIIHSSLSPGGVLIVTVPNGWGPRELLVTKPVQYLQRKNNFLSRSLRALKTLLGYRGTTVQSSADDLSHIQFFTVRTLRQLAETSGFTITVFRKTNFIEQVFPFSLLTNRSTFLQKADAALAENLPLNFTSGFMTVWKKR